ncbi:PAS domain S-box protein [Scytonema sp. NUACC21]
MKTELPPQRLQEITLCVGEQQQCQPLENKRTQKAVYQNQVTELSMQDTNQQQGENQPTQPFRSALSDEARFRYLSEAACEGIILHDGSIILDANSTLINMTGYEAWELVGMSSFALFTPESLKLIKENTLLGCKKPYEGVVVRKDGFTIPVELQGKIISYQGKQIQALAIRDITAQKQAEKAWRTREDWLIGQSKTLVKLARSQTFQQGNLNLAFEEITEAAAQALEVERVGVWLYSKDFSKIECVDLYDTKTKRHARGTSLLKANYPTYFQVLEEQRTLAVDDAIRDRRTQELSESYLSVLSIASLLNASIWLEGRLIGVVCHEHTGSIRQWTLEEENFVGSIADFVALAVEASERHTLYSNVRQSEAWFRAIVENASMGIGLVEMYGRIVEANPVLCQMLGYSQQELYGKNFTDYIFNHPGDLEIYQELLSGDKKRLDMEKCFLHRDGQPVWGHLSISLIPDTNGEPQFYLVTIQDITKRKETELKLHESKEAAEAGSKAKSEFLATMSHELRTPLNAIMGLSQLLQQEIVGSLNDKQKEYINCIYNSGEHLLALINDILDLSKVEAGKEELFLSPVYVEELCNYVISTVRDRATEKGLQLTVEIDKEADICYADDRRIKQILLNLLTNAIKFTPAGKVSLEVKKLPQGITFAVKDTGIGIDKSQFQFLFEPFKQLDSRLNRQYEGTGLGLALTLKLAQLHGGDVTVESTLGEGSCFTLFLPCEHQADSGDSQTISSSSLLLPAASPMTSSKRILLVEHDEHTAILLQDYLQTIGYQVERVIHGNGFLEQVRDQQPDLILLDVELLGAVTGWDLLRQLRQQSDLQDLPVVVMIPLVMASDRERIKQVGANDCLSKPISIVQLESILMRYLT